MTSENLELSIVIPTYNERYNLQILIPKIEEVFKNTRHEIIVVDDNSPDNTAGCAAELNKKYGNICVINRKQKQGIGAALRYGYTVAQGKIILSTDADLSFAPEDMPRLIARINEGYDLVIGCRHSLQGSFYEMKKSITVIKGAISKTGNIILRCLTGLNVHDFSANFRAIRREAWEVLDIKENANIVLFEIIIKAKHKGMKISEVPVPFVERIYGESKLNLFIEIPKYIFKMLYYIIKYR